ncbi:MAG: hypothetical protein JWL92_598 [Candidatus Nomurabacteria bacterium]|nr:hypothetical protein [Candidatus Nomurabacteria bacterium]
MKFLAALKRIGGWFMKKWALPRVAVILVSLFALIGLVFAGVFVAMQYGLLNVKGSSTARNISLGAVPQTAVTSTCAPVKGVAPKSCDWSDTSEWSVLHNALKKDSAVLDTVSGQTGVSARMIASAVVPEQLRYFTSNRESFKKYFEPLKILSSLSKFSLGVSGIKQDTAVQIEQYANNPNSQFYPGSKIASLLAYPAGVDHDTELYNRLTDTKSHYYSYLYTAVFIKEIEAQWQRAGYDVTNRPDVTVTLFNIGFGVSHPNANPRVAGSIITLGGKDYTFGELGALFYQSGELLDVLPR